MPTPCVGYSGGYFLQYYTDLLYVSAKDPGQGCLALLAREACGGYGYNQEGVA
jgi:hypothetical protein